MPAEDVLYEVDGAIALVTLNRPKYRNAQSWPLLDALDDALDRAMRDGAVRVVLVRGAGEHFSSGHDLGTPEQRADWEARGIPEGGIEFYEAFRKYNLDYTLKWRNLPKPTIAVVRGYCIFGGWMIAAAMDLVFASPDARFLAGLVEYFSLPWDIHPRKAKELAFESRCHRSTGGAGAGLREPHLPGGPSGAGGAGLRTSRRRERSHRAARVEARDQQGPGHSGLQCGDGGRLRRLPGDGPVRRRRLPP